MSEIQEVKSRVNTLEQTLASFMGQTEMAIVSLKAQMADFKDEMKVFKDEMAVFRTEMKEFKEEMREDRKAFQEQLQQDTQKFREDMRHDTQKFKEEMRLDRKAFQEHLQQDTQKFREEMRRDMKEVKDEMRADRKNLNLQWGHLANRLGTLSRDIAAPGVHGIVRDYLKVHVDQRMVDWYVKDPENSAEGKEFDVVAYAGPYLVICEIKSKPKPEYVRDFLNSVEGDAYRFFPDHRNKKLIPVFSSLMIPDHLVVQLTKGGALAMAMGENHMEVINPEVVEKLK